MSIFEDVKQLAKERIASVVGLQLARDRKSYACPLCGNGLNHGKGDGLVWTELGRRGAPNWWCPNPSCDVNRNFSNVDLIAAVEGINPSEYGELARRLAELFPEYATDNSFSFQKRKPPAASKRLKLENTPARATEKNLAAAAPSKRNTYSEMVLAEQSPEDVKASRRAEENPAPKNYSRAYEVWRRKYSLEKFIDEQGLWRGFDYEFLNSVGAIFNPEYMVGVGETAPAIILPYDENFYFWREVGGSRKGVPKGCRRDKIYVANPINKGEWVTFDDGKSFFVSMNIIFEGVIDALSLKQAFIRENCKLFLEDTGILAVGSASYARGAIDNLIAEYSEAKDKPKFLVLFDNDSGDDGAKRLVADLREAGFLAARNHFGELGGEKIDANDILVKQGADALIRAVCDLIDVGGF